MARNADPGFAHRYSKPSDLKTSIMKSAPGRSVVWTSTLPVVPGASATGFSEAAVAGGVATAIAATDEAAALERKLRRPTRGVSGPGIGGLKGRERKCWSFFLPRGSRPRDQPCGFRLRFFQLVFPSLHRVPNDLLQAEWFGSPRQAEVL